MSKSKISKMKVIIIWTVVIIINFVNVESISAQSLALDVIMPDGDGYIRRWDGKNPFQQPMPTTDYYGSGDVNNDSLFTVDDIVEVQAMASGQKPPSYRADVDGNEMINQNDVILITSSIINGSILPGWWDKLNTREQRTAWVEKILSLDDVNLHPYYFPWYICHNFATQLLLNSIMYRDDTWRYFNTGGQRGYNLPMYYVSLDTVGHAINAILVGDNPLNIADWLFIEPQNDQIEPIENNAQLGFKLTIWGGGFFGGGAFYENKWVIFTLTDTGWISSDLNPDFIISRPALRNFAPKNNVDVWRPTVLPGDPPIMLYERNADDFSRMYDIFEANPFLNDPSKDTRLSIPGIGYNRIVDAVKDSNEIIHLLWTGQMDYQPGVFYGKLNAITKEVTDIFRLTDHFPILETGRIVITPDSIIHIFWLEGTTFPESEQWSGLYWTKKTESGWQSPQNLTPGASYWRAEQVNSPLTHWLNGYLFDAAVSKNGEIYLIYTFGMDIIHGTNNKVYLFKYDGTWSSGNDLVGVPPIDANGIDIAFDSHDILHILYWLADPQVNQIGTEGNVYEIRYNKGIWANPTLLDNSKLAQSTRLASGNNDSVYAIWERKINGQVVPVWNQYTNGRWNISQVLPVRQGADAWYPTVTVLPGENLFFAWSSRSNDWVTFETASSLPLSPQKTNYLPIIYR